MDITTEHFDAYCEGCNKDTPQTETTGEGYWEDQIFVDIECDECGQRTRDIFTKKDEDHSDPDRESELLALGL